MNAVRLRIRQLHACMHYILYIYIRTHACMHAVYAFVQLLQVKTHQTFFKHYKLSWFARIKLINKKK